MVSLNTVFLQVEAFSVFSEVKMSSYPCHLRSLRVRPRHAPLLGDFELKSPATMISPSVPLMAFFCRKTSIPSFRER